MWDVSPQLLLSARPNPIQHHFPHLLPHLCIDLGYIFADTSVMKKMIKNDTNIQSLEIAPDSLDCVIILTTGDIIVESLKSSTEWLPSYLEVADEELISLRNLPSNSTSKYFPVLLLAPQKGRVSACALADLGR
jgi:syntaxin-binding protein 5